MQEVPIMVKEGYSGNADFDAIYNEHYGSVFYWIRRYVPEREEAEDLTADIFVRLWQSNWQEIENIAAFLYRISRNYTIDFLRKKRRDEMHLKLLAQEPNEQDDMVIQDDVKLLVLREIQREIERLKPRTRRIFKMAYLDSKTNEEIMRATGLSYQHVRNAKSRALKAIRIALMAKGLQLSLIMLVKYCSLLAGSFDNEGPDKPLLHSMGEKNGYNSTSPAITHKVSVFTI